MPPECFANQFRGDLIVVVKERHPLPLCHPQRTVPVAAHPKDKENGIWFLDGLDTSEDVYFNRRANIMARVLYGEGGACEKSPVYYRWIWREGSAFNRTYNGRCYEEEFYRKKQRGSRTTSQQHRLQPPLPFLREAFRHLTT